jgi:hypothetical protein
VHGLIDDVVADPHDLWKAEVTDGSNHQSGHGGLRVESPAGHGAQTGPEKTEDERKQRSQQAADDAEDRIRHQLAGVFQRDGGDAEQGFSAHESTHDDDAGYGGENERAEDRGAPAADDFLNDEQDRCNGSVKGSSETGGGANGGEHAETAARQVQVAGNDGGNARSDLERGIFGSERLAAADGQGGGEEFSDDGAEGDVAVVDIEGGFGLVDAAAARGGEEPDDERGHDQARNGGNEEQAQLAGMGCGPEREDLDPLDSDAEGDHQQTGNDSDEDGENEEQALIAGGCDAIHGGCEAGARRLSAGRDRCCCGRGRHSVDGVFRGTFWSHG